jgi:hypothetical protein
MTSAISFLVDTTAEDLIDAANESRSLAVTAAPSFLQGVAEEIDLGTRDGAADSLARILSDDVPVSCYGIRDGERFQAQISPSAIPDAVAEGHSIVAENVRRDSPALALAGNELRDAVGFAPVVSSVHFSLSNRGNAVPTHFDGAEVLMIQLAGTKTFHVGRAAEIDFPERSMFHASQTAGARDDDRVMPDWFPNSFPSGEMLEAKNLSAGQGLFLSRGWWHRTSTPDEFAANVIFSMPSPTLTKLAVKRLSELLIAEPSLRAPVIGLWSTDPDVRDAARSRVQSAWPEAVQRAADLLSSRPRPDDDGADAPRA